MKEFMEDPASSGGQQRAGGVARGRKPRWGGQSGQSVVEYMFASLSLLFLFSAMYGFIQGQLKTLFTAASRVILRAYH